ncbi:MAG: helix-turn-helix domain-containing protein [Cyclobacteriaceae bacterium]|nr:helix-turn-helix domain-containing protein [Cyclobacteriaceae bacterium]
MYPNFISLDKNQKNEILLVTGSNPSIFYQLQKNLQPTFQVHTISHPEQAFYMTLKLLPSLIISDLHAGGFKLCEQLKKHPSANHIPVILITTLVDPESKIRSFNVGADDLISFPISLQVLQARVNNLISNRLKIRENLQRKLQMELICADTPSMDERFLLQVTKAVADNMNNASFSVNQFAKIVGKSNSQLYRDLIALTGQSPIAFIQHMRLTHAADLIRKRVGNVSEVAYRVGFNNLSYFAKCFKERFGVLPSQFLYNKKV